MVDHRGSVHRRIGLGLQVLAILFATPLCLSGGDTKRSPSTEFGTSSDSERNGSKLIRLELVAEDDAVRPGAITTLAVVYHVEPGWHTYWRNAGDTGSPPGFKFQHPDWLSVGEAVWPAPTRYEHSGGLVDHILEGMVVFLFPVQIDASAPSGDVEIHVTSDWLVCDKICLLGKGEASTRMTVGAVRSPSARSSLVQSARLQLPTKLDKDRSSEVQYAWQGSILEINVDGASGLTLFPSEANSVNAVNLAREGNSKGHSLRIEFDRKPQVSDRVEGVLTVRKGDTVQHHEISFAPTGSVR